MSSRYLRRALVGVPGVPGLGSSRPAAGQRAALIKDLPTGAPSEIQIKERMKPEKFQEGNAQCFPSAGLRVTS